MLVLLFRIHGIFFRFRCVWCNFGRQDFIVTYKGVTFCIFICRAVVSRTLVTAMVLTVGRSCWLYFVGMWWQDGHGQIPTVASFFKLRQSMWNHSAHTLHWIVSSECPVRLAALCPGLHCSVHIIHMKSSDAKEHVQFSTFEKSTKNCKTLLYSYFLLWACMSY